MFPQKGQYIAALHLTFPCRLCGANPILEQRVKAVDMLLKDGTITALEQRLRRLEKEVQHRGEERAIA